MRLVFVTGGSPGATAPITVSDIATVLANVYLYQDGTVTGKKAKYCMITIETNAIRYGLGGGVPTQGGSPDTGIHARVGDVIKLASFAAIKSFRHINHTNAANAVIQVTSEF